MTVNAVGDTAVVTQDRPPTRVRTGREQAIAGQILLYAVLVVLAIIYIYPFLVQVATSFKTDAEAAADPISLIPNVFWRRGVRDAVHSQRLPAVVHELRDRDDRRDAGSRVLRLARRATRSRA